MALEKGPSTPDTWGRFTHGPTLQAYESWATEPTSLETWFM